MDATLSGIVAPMTTPFRPDGSIDEDALRAETRHLIEACRVHGLAVGGSTGEGHALTTDELRRLTAVVAREQEDACRSWRAISVKRRAGDLKLLADLLCLVGGRGPRDDRHGRAALPLVRSGSGLICGPVRL